MAEINIEKMAHNVAQKAIQELRDNGVFVSRWIPVSERLPKPNECVGNVCRYCLIQNEYGDMMVARWDGQGWEQMYQYGEYIEDDVTAWMPLPEPYEPQERSDKE